MLWLTPENEAGSAESIFLFKIIVEHWCEPIVFFIKQIYTTK